MHHEVKYDKDTLVKLTFIYTISESIFKLLHVFGDITRRKLIAVELQDNIKKLLTILAEEINMFDEILKTQDKMINDFGGPIVDRNLPRVSGHLRLLNEVKTQVAFSLQSLKDVQHPIVETQEAADIIERAVSIIDEIKKKEDETFSNWYNYVEKNTIKVN